MNNKKQVENFLADILRDGVERAPPKMNDKHGRPLKRSSLAMYINQVGNVFGVKFYTKTNLNGLLVVGVRV